MSFNRTMKYFKEIRAYVFCDICNEIITININKDDIRNGLQTGLFIHKFRHKNEKPDLDDVEDKSWEEHTTAVYINSEYEVRGIKNFFKDALEEEGVKEGQRIPVVQREIPAMSVHLGMISPEEFKILQLCNGENTMESVSEISGVEIDDLDVMMIKLKEKGLVNVIKRG